MHRKTNLLKSLVKKKVKFIINPIAGARNNDSIPDLIRQVFEGQDFVIDLAETNCKGHAFDLASIAARESYDYVVAVGGDGTINETASALMNSQVSLGIIPCGSGNGLARHLGIPMQVTAALQLILRQKSIRIDAGMVNGKPFFCTAGIGFDAHIGKLFASTKKRGFNTYIRTVLQEFFTYQTDTYTITKSGQNEKREAFLITFANASQYGNNAYISPEADIRDGLLDLCIVKPYPKYRTVNICLRLFNKTLHKSRDVEITHITEARIDAGNPTCYHLDGEHFELDAHIEVKVVPQCLNVLV